MTLQEQRRWLVQQAQTCAQLINEPMVIGQGLRHKAAEDLVAIRALLETVDAAMLPLLRGSATPRRKEEECPTNVR